MMGKSPRMHDQSFGQCKSYCVYPCFLKNEYNVTLLLYCGYDEISPLVTFLLCIVCSCYCHTELKLFFQ